MKKFVYLIIASLFLFSLSSCGLLKLPGSVARLAGRTLGVSP